MITVIPDSIPFSSILVADRLRTELVDIPSLAEAIYDEGLIQPLVLSSSFALLAGGRRHAALELLISEDRLDPVLYHASSCVVGRPGFVLRSEPSLLEQKSIELKENLDRRDLDWRDALRAVVRLYKLAASQAESEGLDLASNTNIPQFLSERIDRDFGALLGVASQNHSAALILYNQLERDPKPYAQCKTIKDAYTICLKEESRYVARLFGARGIANVADIRDKGRVLARQLPPVPGPNSGQRSEPAEPISPSTPGVVLVSSEGLPLAAPLPVSIPLSSAFFQTDGLAFMAEQNPGFTNHIVCDPDYAVDLSVIDSHPNNRHGIMSDGIAQRTVSKSLEDLFRLFPLAYRALPENGGYFIFWYAQDHHEKLQEACRACGFIVQPHALIWNKIDYTGRSNSAPNYQWPKSTEYAMVCRKGDARLTKVQTSNVYAQDAKSVTKLLDHAFAKPFEVWRWIYRAIAIKGQRVFDPFVGSGSSAISAVMEGLSPIGCEIQEDNYNKLMLNMRAFYRKHIGEHVTFT